MQRQSMASKSGTPIGIDVCFGCQAIWFDKGESWQLAPDGVVELFQLVQKAGRATTPQFAERIGCPHCRSTMQKSRDLVKTSEFTFLNCTNDHGRLITFHQFLVEKQFVRELSAAERTTLSAQVSQIRCSGCGAGVNLKTESACGYCRAPIAVFDRQAAQKAIDHYLLERGKQLPAAPPAQRPETAPMMHRSDGFDLAGIGMDIVWAMASFAGRSSRRSSHTADGSQAGSGVFNTGGFEPVPASDVLPSADELMSGLAGAAQAGLMQGGISQGVDSLGAGILDSVDFSAPLADIASSTDLSSIVESVSTTDFSSITDLVDSSDAVDLVNDGIGSFLGSLFD